MMTIAPESKVDHLEAVMATLPQVQLPLVHRFTPGLYVREIFMPKGSLVISKRHKTTHPYVISKGRVAVWTAENGVKILEAPFCGVTEPGTRRVLYIHEDCVWTTFHPTLETDLQKIEDEVIEPHEIGEPTMIDQAILKQLEIL